MGKTSKSKAKSKSKKEKVPTYAPSAAMRRRETEEKREKEERDQQRRAKKLNKKNVLPPPPPPENVEHVAGRLKAVREEEDNELETDTEGVHGEGMKGVVAAVEPGMNMAQGKQEDEDRSNATPENKLLSILIKRFEDSFYFENSLPSSDETEISRKSLLSTREKITTEMAATYGKLGIKVRDIWRI